MEELAENFDLDERGYLTLKGFIEMYQLQTLSDEDETLKDMKTHALLNVIYEDNEFEEETPVDTENVVTKGNNPKIVKTIDVKELAVTESL